MRQKCPPTVAASGAAGCFPHAQRSIVTPMPFYLGIDAGGTQTTCAVGDGTVVLGRAQGAACKLSKVTEKRAGEVLQALIKESCETGGTKPADLEHTCIGVAGISGQKVSETMRGILAKIVRGEITV